jgi:hypothetical protein
MNDERIHRKALQETIYGKRAVGKLQHGRTVLNYVPGTKA